MLINIVSDTMAMKISSRCISNTAIGGDGTDRLILSTALDRIP